MIPVFWFIAGTLLGSFFVNLGIRMADGRDMSGRSKCDACDHVLSPLELLPVFGPLSNGFRCRHCNARISGAYSVLEVICGVALAFVSLRDGSAQLRLLAGLLVLLYTSQAAADWFHMLLPNRLVLASGVTGLVFSWARGDVLGGLFGALAGLVLLGVVYLARPDGLGAGDVKLAAAMGTAFGLPRLFHVLAASFILAMLFSVLCLALKRKSRNDPIPLGFFMATGAILGLVY